MEIQKLPPTILTVAMPRLIDHVHLVTASFERYVPDSEILAP
jgi:hypothetical protein